MGMPRVQFFPDRGARWPLWFEGEGGIDASHLDLSPQLSADLEAWVRVWSTHFDPTVWSDNWDDPSVGHQWITDGHVLVERLRHELDGRTTVVPMFADSGPEGVLRKAE